MFVGLTWKYVVFSPAITNTLLKWGTPSTDPVAPLEGTDVRVHTQIAIATVRRRVRRFIFTRPWGTALVTTGSEVARLSEDDLKLVGKVDPVKSWHRAWKEPDRPLPAMEKTASHRVDGIDEAVEVTRSHPGRRLREPTGGLSIGLWTTKPFTKSSTLERAASSKAPVGIALPPGSLPNGMALWQ
jgi:hypothetical protein